MSNYNNNNNQNNNQGGVNQNQPKTTTNEGYRLKFNPMISTMFLESKDVAIAINTHMRSVIQGVSNAGCFIEKNEKGQQHLVCSIMIDPSLTQLIKTSELAKLGATDAYKPTEELKTKLKPYLGKNELRLKTIYVKGVRKVIVNLDANSVIDKVIEKAPTGYGYSFSIEQIYDQGKSFTIRLEQVKLEALQAIIQSTNAKNGKGKNQHHNHNNGKRHHNNHNRNNNRNYNR